MTRMSRSTAARMGSPPTGRSPPTRCGSLAPNGHLVVELGAGAATAVSRIFAAAGLTVAGPPRHDLAGIPRALHIIRSG